MLSPEDDDVLMLVERMVGKPADGPHPARDGERLRSTWGSDAVTAREARDRLSALANGGGAASAVRIKLSGFDQSPSQLPNNM